MKSIFYTVASIVVGAILTSCCACIQGSPKIGQLEENKWKMVEFENKKVPTDKAIVMTFDNEKKMVYGDAPCNNFFASYSTLKEKDRNIEIKNGGATRMLCPDSQIEDSFVRQLTDITRVQVEGEMILLINKSGDLLAIFEAVR